MVFRSYRRRYTRAHLFEHLLGWDAAIHDPSPPRLAVLVSDPREKVLQRRFVDGIAREHLVGEHASVIEGINNKIKVIKRMPYGFRDDRYFFLKIRAAFPGIG